MNDRHLTPADAVVALRSFPRRFRSSFARPDDEQADGAPLDPDEVGRRFGPDGTSAVEHLLAADGLLTMLDRGIEQARGGETLHPTFGGLSRATWDDDGSPVPVLLDRLEDSADRAARRVDSVPTDDWGTPVQIAGHGAGQALLELVQDVVAVTASHLRAADAVLDAVRR